MLTRLRTSGIDEAALWDAVAAVEDPEIHRSLGELGMLRQARAGRGGQVHIEVALTTPACPLRERLRDDATAAATTVAGVSAVDVSFDTLSERERLGLTR